MRVLAVLIALLALPALAYAAGPHEGLDCVGCHGIHTGKGDVIFAVDLNKKAINPRTNAPNAGTTAFCLGCHETIDKGGMGILPVSASMSHPFGIKPNPKVANVPDVFLRNSQLECVSCHDPHPSNPNYKYLRVDTKGGSSMQSFCAMCHSSKTDAPASSIKIFSSMDERQSSGYSAPAAPMAPAPKK